MKLLLELPHGILSHDTFRRVFARIHPEESERRFMSWVQRTQELSQAEMITIDGKQLRGSSEAGIGKGAIEIVSA